MSKRILFCLGVILFFCTKAYAAAPLERVQILLEYKQARAMFATPYEDFLAGIERFEAYTPIGEERAKKIKEIAKKIYKQDNVYAVYEAAYATFADPRVVEMEIRLYESKPGKIFQAAHLEMAQPDFANKSYQYWQKRSLENIKPNRKNSISSFFKKTKLAEAKGTYHAGMDVGISLAMNAFKRRNIRKTLKKIKSETRLRKNNYVLDSSTQTLQDYTFGLRQLKNIQIDWFTRFFYTRNGDKAVKTHRKAIEIAMDRAGQTLMHTLNPDTKIIRKPMKLITKPKADPKAKKEMSEATATEDKNAKPKVVNPLQPKPIAPVKTTP